MLLNLSNRGHVLYFLSVENCFVFICMEIMWVSVNESVVFSKINSSKVCTLVCDFLERVLCRFSDIVILG